MYLGRVLSFVCFYYGWTHKYIFKELTWKQFWIFYEYAQHYRTNGEYVVDEEPPPITTMNKDVKIIDGVRVISK